MDNPIDQEITGTVIPPIKVEYPGALERLKAVFIDGFVITGLLFVSYAVFANFEDAPGYARMWVFITIFGLYEPVLTSLTGATVGHRIVGIRVTRANDRGRNINFVAAIIRYALKATLGGFSLLTVSANKRGQAMHDWMVNSSVEYS